MADGKKHFRCEINTPDGPVLAEDVCSVNLPALDGYMGILPNRAPVTAVVATGTISLELVGGESRELFVSHGFCQVRQNHVTVLAEECKPISQLDPENAWDLLQRAYKLPSLTAEQRQRRDEAIQEGRIRFSLAQKGRKGMASMEQLMKGGL